MPSICCNDAHNTPWYILDNDDQALLERFGIWDPNYWKQTLPIYMRSKSREK
jgi:hypothetical protein